MQKMRILLSANSRKCALSHHNKAKEPEMTCCNLRMFAKNELDQSSWKKEKSIAAPSVVQVGVWCSSNHQCRQIGLGWLFDGDDCCCCKLLIIMTLSFAGRWQKK